MSNSGADIMSRIEALAKISECDTNLTRTFLTDAHQKSARQLMQWMDAAGMDTSIDAIGNVIGRYEGSTPGLPALVVGSHYDTVSNAGKYDGLLGILVGIACIEEFSRNNKRFPFAIEVVGFSEEEGVRYGATLLGSRGFAGTFDFSLLDKLDSNGISMADAIRHAGLDPNNISNAARDSTDVLAYIEAHIEQGPVLLEEDLPVGIVTSIAGATRFQFTLAGPGGHAGTLPMKLRSDPLGAAAELVLFIEQRCSKTDGLFGTVGVLNVLNGSTNTVPMTVEFSVDVRAGDDASRSAIVDDLLLRADEISMRRKIQIEIKKTHEASAAACSEFLMNQLDAAVEQTGTTPRRLVSGAGHDAMALPGLTDIAMLFVRCGNNGISHHPDESMTAADAEMTIKVFHNFIRNFQPPKDLSVENPVIAAAIEESH